MNTKNNRRRQQSRERIEGVFLELLEGKEIGQITVSDLCKLTGLNRSTFYANYADVYDLADQLRQRLEGEVAELYEHDIANKCFTDGYLRLFHHIRDHQLFYKTYFKLGYDHMYRINLYELVESDWYPEEEYLEYHIEFHRAGFNGLVKKWLSGGCKEPPETMCQIVRQEYRGRGRKAQV